MVTELRKTGIDVVGGMALGTHFCVFYETKQDLLDMLVSYFKAGLENKEFCLWVISELLTEEEIRNALRQAVPDLDRYLAERSIEILSHDEWYLKGGAFDPYGIIHRLNEKLDQALARGYAGMRMSGSTAWLQKKDGRNFREYERELDDSIANQRMIVLCTLPLSASGAAEILDAASTHQVTVALRNGNWEVIEIPELKQTKEEIKARNEELNQRVIERTRALATANEELKREVTERKQAEDRLRATSQQLRALSASLQSAREEERTRIAREIHDELGSALTSLKWDLEALDKIFAESGDQAQLAALREKTGTMIRLTDTTINAVRRIASELRPSILDDLGLVEAIEWQAQQFQARTNIVCHCDCSLQGFNLNREQSTAVFRIFQEALTNILRHAQATRVDITLEEKAGELILTIRDDGRGITADEKSDQLSLGLLGMQERVHLVGGTMDITGVKGKGTTVMVRVPLSG